MLVRVQVLHLQCQQRQGIKPPSLTEEYCTMAIFHPPALSFLGPRGPVARDVESSFYYDNKHAGGVCLGTIQARTHLQLALACQRSMLCAQHRLRLTMQHVYGHTWNLGHVCADHAAALGSLGLISIHNVATRWVRHNFDTSACCENLFLKERRHLKMGGSAVFIIEFFVSLTYALCHLRFCSQPLFPRIHSALQEKQWKAQLHLSLQRRVLWWKLRPQRVESSPGSAFSRAD